MSNEIVLENQKQGTPESVWQLSGPPSSSIEGFTTDISTDIGQTVDFKINTASSNYRIEIYRIGYYGGDGARLVDTIQHQSGISTNQPSPLTDPTTGLVDAGNWSITDSWNVPSDAVSGTSTLLISFAGMGQRQKARFHFIVRNDSSTSDIVFQNIRPDLGSIQRLGR